MFHHYLLVYPALYPYNIHTPSFIVWALTFSPLHLLWAGYEAVILFFILSGYVLSLPYHQNSQDPYWAFLIKRFSRIYLPYVSAITLAVLLSLLFNGPISSLSEWFNHTWTNFSWRTIAIHLSLLGHWYDTSTRLDPVVWSLTYEMQMSIIFPILIFTALNIRLKLSLVLGLIGSAASYLIPGLEFSRYGLMFLVGVFLARHYHDLRIFYGSLSRAARYCLIFVAFIAYSSQWYWYNQGSLHKVLSDWVIAMGATGIIITVLYSNHAKRLLRVKTLVFIGKISFSIYLLHSIVMLALVHAFYGKIPLVELLILSVGITLILSSLTYRWVEMPSVRFGRTVISVIKKNKAD